MSPPTTFHYRCFSKPITYAVTLSELGEEVVHKYQGREPSGRKINEIVLDYNSEEVKYYYFCITSSTQMSPL